MLHQFLQANRDEILALCEQKTKKLAGSLKGSAQLKVGLPLFFDQLVKVLDRSLSERPQRDMLKTAATHGKEFLVLGYSLSHVVHAYGAMCQAITELATVKNAKISPKEFNILNSCLDVAIASAVSEFQYRETEANDVREVKHLGFLAHELRNALSGATIAQEMIRAGLVGVGGSTATVLEANLVRMGNLIDRSLSEVRMRAHADLCVEKFKLADLFDQVAITAKIEASKKHQTIAIHVSWDLEVDTDKQLLMSAVANLVQNAIKYSKSDTEIAMRGWLADKLIHIEVQDACGGLNPDKIKTLFEPYVQENADHSGLGLGLAITQRAISLCQGKLSVNNAPGQGCTFVIELPEKLTSQVNQKQAVPGEDSVQPDFKS